MQDKLSEVTLILIGSTLIILILTGLIIISLFISQKRKFRHHQEKLDMKNNFDNELLRSRLEIQSQAFESISRELHDNVGTLISIAMVHVKSQGERKNGEDISKRDEVTSLLNEAMDASGIYQKALTLKISIVLDGSILLLPNLKSSAKQICLTFNTLRKGNHFQ
jgi:glucose-6-phosphate-specific signal transduction histidine kinase